MSTVLVYSDDARIRERVRLAIGRRPDPQMEPIDYLDAAEGAAVTLTVARGGIDLCILDGEAKPSGGLGLARELRDEVDDMPATIVLLGRRDDAWLGRWSKADALASRRADPVELTDLVIRLLRERAAASSLQAAPVRPQLSH